MEALQNEVEAEPAHVRMVQFTSSETKCVLAMMQVMRYMYIADKNHAMGEFRALVDLNIHLGCKDLALIRQPRTAAYSSTQAVHELLDAWGEC